MSIQTPVKKVKTMNSDNQESMFINLKQGFQTKERTHGMSVTQIHALEWKELHYMKISSSAPVRMALEKNIY